LRVLQELESPVLCGHGRALVDLEQSKIVRRAASYDLQTAITGCTCRILILDGITHTKTEFLDSAFDWMRQDVYRRIIIVSSLQVNIKPEGIAYEGGATFLMPSWTIEEYTEALKDDGVDLPEKILNKYFLASGSARWMFDFTPELVLNLIDEKISRVSGFDGWIFEGDFLFQLRMSEEHSTDLMLKDFNTGHHQPINTGFKFPKVSPLMRRIYIYICL
jgi:hypothetical protein